MALIAKNAGWEIDNETGKREFVIRLVAESIADVPEMMGKFIWDSIPLDLISKEPG